MNPNDFFRDACTAHGTSLPVTRSEAFVTGLYASMDVATAEALERLSREDGVVPPCTAGCSHCCRFFIPTTMVEIHALVQFVKRTFAGDQIQELRSRTRRWHEWDDSRPGRHPSNVMRTPPDFKDDGPCCPLLVRGACSAYPVRPIICRTHYVCTDPSRCLAAARGVAANESPVTIPSIADAGSLFLNQLKAYVEIQGTEYSRTIVLLPHGLAMEMGWDFALSP